jgi:hypothetical protein
LAKKKYLATIWQPVLPQKDFLRTMWHIISSKKMILPQVSLSVAPNRFFGPTDKLT